MNRQIRQNNHTPEFERKNKRSRNIGTSIACVAFLSLAFLGDWHLGVYMCGRSRLLLRSTQRMTWEFVTLGSVALWWSPFIQTIVSTASTDRRRLPPFHFQSLSVSFFFKSLLSRSRCTPRRARRLFLAFVCYLTPTYKILHPFDPQTIERFFWTQTRFES